MANEYGPCSSCSEVQTPLGYICIDCAYPNKRDREFYVTALRESRDAAQAALKDRCVLAALPVAAEMLRLNYTRPLEATEIVGLAHELAAEMLARRDRDEEFRVLAAKLPRVPPEEP